METGRLKWFKKFEPPALPAHLRHQFGSVAPGEMYGFIVPDNKIGCDVLVRARDLSPDTLPNMQEDAKVSFERGSDKGREYATNVTVADKCAL